MKPKYCIIPVIVFFIITYDLLLAQSFTDAHQFGFSTENSGIENAQALQEAVDQQGTIIVSQPGTYKIAQTVYLDSYTTIKFGNNVFLQKVAENEPFTHVFLNKGALTKTYNEHIAIEGLHIQVNGVDKRFSQIYGLRGQIAFFYVKDLRIEHFRMMDLEKMQFGIHVCTFEDVLIEDVIIKGKKDGIHLGRGKRFTIRDAVFQTFDDAIALNAHDYATSNPELGWIEDGIIENCHDLDQENTTGFFCRILAGAWIDWEPGMKVQQSDAVVSNGRIYRVQEKPDGKIYESNTRPTHPAGSETLDGINWGVVQEDVTYTAGVRNVVFRDIYLKKPRIGFSVHFDNDRYSRSYYPGAKIPQQEQLLFDNVRVIHDQEIPLFSVGTPVDVLTITNSTFHNNSIRFKGNKAMPDYLPTKVNIFGCIFNYPGKLTLISNTVDGKQIKLQTHANIENDKRFSAHVESGNGIVKYNSDLSGLKE